MKRGSKAKYILVVVFCLVSLYQSSQYCYAQLTDIDPYNCDISIQYGIDEYAKLAVNLPIEISIDINESIDNAIIQISYVNSDNEVVKQERTTTLKRRETNVLTDILYTNRVDQSIQVAISDSEGNQVYKAENKINVSDINGNEVVGILSDISKNLEYIAKKNTVVVELGIDTIPNQVSGFAMFDIIVISGFDMGDLYSGQYKALVQWVEQGGTLVIGSGSESEQNYSRLCDTFSFQVLDCYSILTSYGLLHDEHMIQYTDIKVTDGRIVYSEDDRPFLQEITYKRGNVLLFSFDLELMNELNESVGDYILSIIHSNLPSSKKQQRETSTTGVDPVDISSLVESALFEVPTIWIYIIILIMYIVCVGPLLYSMLKKYHGLEYMTQGVIVVSLCFSTIVCTIGSKSRITNPYAYSAGVLEVNNSMLTERVSFSVVSPSHDSYEISYPKEYEVHRDSINQESTSRWRLDIENKLLSDYDLRYFSNESQGFVEVKKPVTLSNISFVANKIEDFSGTIRARYDEKGELIGFTNLTGYDLWDACVVMKNKVIYLNQLSNKQTVYLKRCIEYKIDEDNLSMLVNRWYSIDQYTGEILEKYYTCMREGQKEGPFVFGRLNGTSDFIDGLNLETTGTTCFVYVLGEDFFHKEGD